MILRAAVLFTLLGAHCALADTVNFGVCPPGKVAREVLDDIFGYPVTGASDGAIHYPSGSHLSCPPHPEDGPCKRIVDWAAPSAPAVHVECLTPEEIAGAPLR